MDNNRDKNSQPEHEVDLSLPADLAARAREAGLDIGEGGEGDNLQVLEWLMGEMERVVAGMNLKEMAAQLEAIDSSIPRVQNVESQPEDDTPDATDAE